RSVVGGLCIRGPQLGTNSRPSRSLEVFHPAPFSLFGAIEIGHSPVAPLILATIAALYAFTGFESIANAAEEMHEPDRTLPRAIRLSILVVSVVYILAVVVAMLLGSAKVVEVPGTRKLAPVIMNEPLRAILVRAAPDTSL